MKVTVSMIASTAALALLAGCGPKAADKTEVTASNAMAPGMAMPAAGTTQAAKTVKGVGEVTAIDSVAGKITLKHEAIPDAGWPAMTMAFIAAPPIVAKAKVGEKVAFDLKLGAAGGEVTAIRPR
jgi:Cu/Ag efflux protein CusF